MSRFLLQYICPNCGTEWETTWSCACNDSCPQCLTDDVEPNEVDDAD